MTTSRSIEEKIFALIKKIGEELDEDSLEDRIEFERMREFALNHKGIEFYYGQNVYLVIDVIKEKEPFILCLGKLGE